MNFCFAQYTGKAGEAQAAERKKEALQKQCF
jgi:hypothetical protein